MSKTMAEVIQEAIENTPYWIEGDPGTHQDPYANAAAALSAVGFGVVADAKAEAWDEGYNRGTDLAAWAIGNRPQSERPDTDNPYRAVS